MQKDLVLLILFEIQRLEKVNHKHGYPPTYDELRPLFDDISRFSQISNGNIKNIECVGIKFTPDGISIEGQFNGGGLLYPVIISGNYTTNTTPTSISKYTPMEQAINLRRPDGISISYKYFNRDGSGTLIEDMTVTENFAPEDGVHRIIAEACSLKIRNNVLNY